MKFKFPLQKVMDHRKINQDLAQKDFQEVIQRFRDEEEILNKMLSDEHEAHRSAGTFVQNGGHQGPALHQVHEFLQGQKVRVARQKEKVNEMEKLVEAKREILRLASQDYKIMETVKEKKFESYKSERLMQDQKENDELSILRFKPIKES
jgi:flagellar FliJ protein